MATRKRRIAFTNLDLYLISNHRLKQIGLVILLLLLAGGGWFYYRNQQGNPRSNAESAIAEARQALNQLAASKDFNAHQGDFDRAQKRLEEANTMLAAARFSDAPQAAVQSQAIA